MNSSPGMSVASKITNLHEPSMAATEIALPDHQDVIARCELDSREKQKAGFPYRRFAYNERIWINYNHTTEADVAAQQLAYDHADPRIFRVPKIYDWFTKDRRTHIIMEKVNGITYFEYNKQHLDDEAGVFDAIVKAARHLWTFPVSVPGPIGPFRNGIPDDHFFSEMCDGKRNFESAADLQEWCNAKLISFGRPQRVDLSSDPVVFCHLDLRSANIIICEETILSTYSAGGCRSLPPDL
jgi:hypothetical protein